MWNFSGGNYRKKIKNQSSTSGNTRIPLWGFITDLVSVNLGLACFLFSPASYNRCNIVKYKLINLT